MSDNNKELGSKELGEMSKYVAAVVTNTIHSQAMMIVMMKILISVDNCTRDELNNTLELAKKTRSIADMVESFSKDNNLNDEQSEEINKVVKTAIDVYTAGYENIINIALGN